MSIFVHKHLSFVRYHTFATTCKVPPPRGSSQLPGPPMIRFQKRFSLASDTVLHHVRNFALDRKGARLRRCFAVSNCTPFLISQTFRRGFLAIVILFAFTLVASRAASLSASPDHIATDKATITISWSNVAAPSVGDYIGVHSPAEGPFFDRPPWTKLMNSHSTSSGSMTFDLLNWRSSYRFVYYSANGDKIALSNSVSANQYWPTQIHLALGTLAHSMRVMWTTGANDTTSHVVWGYSQSQLHNVVRSKRCHSF